MDRFAKYFVIASLIYLFLGSTLGILMVVKMGSWSGLEYYLIPTHAHLNLLGWVSMMIFGVAYHILPRFTGHTLYSRTLAWAHFILAQAGLLGMALFFFLNRYQEGLWKKELMISGTLMYFSICFFVFNMLKTITKE